MRTSRYRVSGMDCGSCAAKIETALRRVPGIREVRVSVPGGTVTISHEAALGVDAVVRPLAALGYGAAPADPAAETAAPACGGGCCGPAHSDAGHSPTHADPVEAPPVEAPPVEAPWWRGRKAVLTLAAGAALGAATFLGLLVPETEGWAFPLALMVGLVPVARRALAAARAGTPFSIETLMTVAAVGALVIGAVEEAATVLVLFLVGELLEGVAAGRARAGIRGLTALVPDTALIEQHGAAPRAVPAAGLAVGSVILVRPGDRVAADGIVLSGSSAVDESPVTGESMPKPKGAGDPVFAGTINADGALRVRVTAAARDNTIARIVRLVEEAQESKAPTERLIDRFARLYTPGIVAVAVLVAVVPPLVFGGGWTEWIYRALAVLLIGCPCALVISTPAAIAAGLSNGARRGLLLKGGAVLEALGRITTVAFDKTGTLTEGKPRVTDLIPFGGSEGAGSGSGGGGSGGGVSEAELLAAAAALEAGSSHPLARAILAAAAERGIAPPAADEVTALPGAGLQGRVGGLAVALLSPKAADPLLTAEQAERIAALAQAGKTVSVLLVEGRAAGLIALRDEPRADARQGIEALERAGIRSLMVTGDTVGTAGAVAGMLGVEAHAQLLPEDKLRIVRDLQAGGQRVAKVGDGINDAPALAAADVGIAMGGGTDVALETADAAILHGLVGDVAAMVALSRRTMANIRQNIALALGLKAVFLVTTVLGVTGLWPAILADTGATVLVTANALRLLSVRS
ncbi:Lead, cadmium, zinc and mercury-transporting ATPase, P-type family (plasmid) [Azospirillum lipoferum 4B]|uniref:P-type Zn(2+) transporter n=1 Tax=Azospirillum lipoferum (strain 4B) TaxID=862719 RepID=G7ZIT0_AZOL4|nr:Lead, cadmium, zinc and mercury-transporting ATPase, P-type family [Azospirillum lipoferum 4B]